MRTKVSKELAVSLVALLTATVAAADPPTAPTARAVTRPIVGAIRWDAWHTPDPEAFEATDTVRAVERSLGPKQYHYRVPFFGQIISDTKVRISGYTQAIMDQEIAYAKAGGLDYWAFLLYETDSSLSQGLNLYLSSQRKQDIQFCAIASANTLGNKNHFHEGMRRVVALMAEPSYQDVAGNRPLLYVFNVTNPELAAWGGPAKARGLFDELRQAVKAAGHGNPYIVVMDFSAAHGRKMAEAIGAEAISSYATEGGGKAAPYTELARWAHNFWNQCAATGKQVVPVVMAGWDRRPRVEHPVAWEKNQKPGVGLEKYYKMPTLQELALHVEEAMRWVAAKAGRCPAQAVIIYAWNEHDEGGWLCPTLNPDGSANTERLDALAAMLKKWDQ